MSARRPTMDPPLRRPSRRPLRVYALDPLRVDRGKPGVVTPVVTLRVPFEDLTDDDGTPRLGPRGNRIHVIDYDGAQRRYYKPVDLDHPDVLIRDGLPPSETDPRFHQQMLYAVVADVWHDFEMALGRRVSLGSKKTLSLFPHAFYGQNAFYDPDQGAILFGYFKADPDEPGPNIPGQMVFTCLSFDIIVHETTHAFIDRMRPEFNDATNPDVLAFHEGFADLVAIFQHFKLEEVVSGAIADARGDLSRADTLVSLARQFGYATGSNGALRTATEAADQGPLVYDSSMEAHTLGSVLVAAVFDAYLSLYNSRTQDLLRLATGGSGILSAGSLHPDLVQRLAREAAETARQFFTACVRAFDYLPPLDVTFEDFLRALVTVDEELSPSDDSFRVAIIEGFRRRAVYPTSAGSLGDAAVALGAVDEVFATLPIPPEVLLETINDLANASYAGRARVDRHGRAHGPDANADAPAGEDAQDSGTRSKWDEWTKQLHRWGVDHATRLGLLEADEPGARPRRSPLEVEGVHVTSRIAQGGRPSVAIVVRFVQRRHDLAVHDRFSDRLNRYVPKAGCTVVADGTGTIRSIIGKSFPRVEDADTTAPDPANLRLRTLLDRLDRNDRDDPGRAYRDPGHAAARLQVRFSRLHASIDRS